MSSPAGATTHNGAFVQQLPDQNQQALNFESLTNSLLPLASSLPSVNPATSAYNYDLNQSYVPTGDYYLNNYLTGVGGVPTTAMTGALSGANAASSYGLNTLFPQQTASTKSLYNATNANLPYADTIFKDIYSPVYGTTVDNTQTNPYLSSAITGSKTAAGYGSDAAAAAAGAAPSFYTAANQTLNTGFDPQSKLYNRGVQQTADYANATNAMSGIGNTPYGSSVASTALTNYDIDWQDKQLKRQTDAATSASNTALTGYGLGAGASSLENTSAAYPYKTYQGYLSDVLNALKAQSTAGVQAAAGTNELLGSLGTGYTSASTLGNTAATDLSTNTSLPYTTGALIGSNAQKSLSNQQNLLSGQADIGLASLTPQQNLVNELASYLGLGQTASVGSANIGNQGFNQLSSGIGGTISGLSGLNSLLGTGSGGLFSSTGALGSLFGSGSGAAATGIGDAAATGTSGGFLSGLTSLGSLGS